MRSESDGAEVDRAARRLGDGRGRLGPAAVEERRLEQVAHVRAVADTGERVLERKLHATDL